MPSTTNNMNMNSVIIAQNRCVSRLSDDLTFGLPGLNNTTLDFNILNASSLSLNTPSTLEFDVTAPSLETSVSPTFQDFTILQDTPNQMTTSPISSFTPTEGSVSPFSGFHDLTNNLEIFESMSPADLEILATPVSVDSFNFTPQNLDLSCFFGLQPAVTCSGGVDPLSLAVSGVNTPSNIDYSWLNVTPTDTAPVSPTFSSPETVTEPSSPLELSSPQPASRKRKTRSSSVSSTSSTNSNSKVTIPSITKKSSTTLATLPEKLEYPSNMIPLNAPIRKRKRKSDEPEVSPMPPVVEEEVNLEGLDETEAKRVKNTLSARASRARKAARITYLEGEVNRLTEEVEERDQEIERLRELNEKLMGLVGKTGMMI
ncbi:hypothetical protein BKA69DRAFT_1123946 [Paraphysoderma sedebokerense]|nr:hypothetical protein BKA69DRAFT_1123946 [Paraphysoderma sedebokerense]